MISERRSVREEPVQSLEGKRVLVTGGTTGIGRAIAEALVVEGARVLVFGRDKRDLQDALDSLQATGEAHGLSADQAEPEALDRVFEAVARDLGGLDVLINNAAESAGSVVDTAEDEWAYVVSANLLGYMRCSARAIPLLRDGDGGMIVNVGSMSAKLREEGSDVYVATKSGIRGFSDSLGKQLADEGIRVTLVEPGLVQSELSDKPEEEERKMQEEMKMLLAEDVARTVLHVLRQPVRCHLPMVQVKPLRQKI